ncbi:MAG: LicD family protein [Weeksellaceae bacterium]
MNQKLKIIGFGIGTSSKQYLENYRDEHEIIALSDWDETTHGTMRYGFEIINPYEFEKYEYDKIIILSFYVKEIIQQLKERLNIDPDKIIVPPKHKIKGGILPFQHQSTKKFAGELIVYFNKMAEKADIDLFLEFGTLLGLTRDGDVIDWDDDVDFGINEEDSDKLVETLLQHKTELPYSDKLNWTANIREDKDNNVWYVSLSFTNKKEFLFHPFEIAFGVRKFFGDRSVCMRNSYLSCDKEHFIKNETIKFLNAEIKVPYKHEKFLDLLYGDWRTPQVYTFGSHYGSSHSGSNEEVKVSVEEKTLF